MTAREFLNGIDERTFFRVNTNRCGGKHPQLLMLAHLFRPDVENFARRTLFVRTMHVQKKVDLIFECLQVSTRMIIKDNQIDRDAFFDEIRMTAQHLPDHWKIRNAGYRQKDDRTVSGNTHFP